MMFRNALLAFAAATSIAVSAQASTVVTATDTGWINASGGDDSGGAFANGIHNNYTGYENQTFNNWFQFTLPSTTIGSATLSIYNYANNTTIDPTAVYTVYGASGFSFAGLQSGPALGSILFSVADNGTDHWVDISLNGAGIAWLNANLGSTIVLSGSPTSSVTISTCFDCVAAFGYSDGTPAATLTLDSVPEPASWALMIAGFGMTGFAMRRRQAVVTA